MRGSLCRRVEPGIGVEEEEQEIWGRWWKWQRARSGHVTRNCEAAGPRQFSILPPSPCAGATLCKTLLFAPDHDGHDREYAAAALSSAPGSRNILTVVYQPCDWPSQAQTSHLCFLGSPGLALGNAV